MENKTYTNIQQLSSNSDRITTTATNIPNSFILSPSINTVSTTPSLQTLQVSLSK